MSSCRRSLVPHRCRRVGVTAAAVGLLAVFAAPASADVFGPLDEPTPIDTEPAVSIAPDKDDYTAGELVTLTGAGWAPSESVAVAVVDDGLQEVPWRHDATASADADGNLVVSFYLPDWFVARYFVTATGESSGVATSTFTDALLPARGCPVGSPIVVTTAADEFNPSSTTNTTCSLREAINAANGDGGADTITLPNPSTLATPATAYT